MVATAPTYSIPPAKGGAYLQWRDYRIHYVKGAEQAAVDHPERPPLLLIHGFGASTDHWRKNIAELQNDFEVYALDLIGFGRSSKPSGGYSNDLWRDQIADFITRVIGRPAVVAGNSIGGYSSLYIGATRPDAVAGVCMLNGVGSFSEQQTDKSPNPFKAAIGQLIKTVVLSPLPSWMVFQFVKKRSYIRKTLEQVYVNEAEVTDQLIEDIYRPATRGELFQNHYTTLEEHHINAGHCPHDDAPAEVNELLRNWVLSTVVPAATSATPSISGNQWIPLG